MAAWMLDVLNSMLQECLLFFPQPKLAEQGSEIVLLYFIQKITNTSAYSMPDSTDDNYLEAM